MEGKQIILTLQLYRKRYRVNYYRVNRDWLSIVSCLSCLFIILMYIETLLCFMHWIFLYFFYLYNVGVNYTLLLRNKRIANL